MIIAIVIGVNAGIISAWFQNSWFDYTAMIVALIGVSVPVFWLGLMEQWTFSSKLGWLPTSGREDVRNPITAITHFYLLDTLIQGRFDQFVEVLKRLILPVSHLQRFRWLSLPELQGLLCWKLCVQIMSALQEQKAKKCLLLFISMP